MKFGTVKILADENVSPRVVAFLRLQGLDVIDVKEMGWQGTEDRYLLGIAYDQKRFVLTHDSDFGMLAINEGVPYYGIIYMRLKNLSVTNIINVLQRLLKIDQEINEGALIVVEDTRVRIRTISE